MCLIYKRGRLSNWKIKTHDSSFLNMENAESNMFYARLYMNIYTEYR